MLATLPPQEAVGKILDNPGTFTDANGQAVVPDGGAAIAVRGLRPALRNNA